MNFRLLVFYVSMLTMAAVSHTRQITFHNTVAITVNIQEKQQVTGPGGVSKEIVLGEVDLEGIESKSYATKSNDSYLVISSTLGPKNTKSRRYLRELRITAKDYKDIMKIIPTFVIE